MKEIEDIFDKIREENLDFEERVGRGDLFIPHILTLNKKIKINEVLYLSAYYCWNKNIEKADKYSYLNKSQIYRAKKHLCELGYLKLKNKSAKEIKEETIEKSHKGKKCEWCKQECYVLQEHHYPILAKDGGKEIVNICPNCHYTFHKLESEIYE